MSKIITVDGPSGVGKGTLAAFLSKYLGWDLLDSGAIYRVAALYLIDNKLNPVDRSSIEKLKIMPVKFDIKNGKSVCLLNDVDVSRDIRAEQCGMMASKIAAIPEVRAALLDRQHRFDNGNGLVADGRDMGTVVFPDAMLKFYLTASSESRADRRYKELTSKGEQADFEEVLNNIVKRDSQDQNRKVAPLVPAEDAIVVDTSNLSISDVQSHAVAEIKKVKKD